MHIVIVSVALLFQSSALHCFFFEYVNHFFIDKSRAAVLEWAVPMSSDWIYLRVNLNTYSDSLCRTFVSKFSTTFVFFEYVNHFFIDKSRAAHV